MAVIDAVLITEGTDATADETTASETWRVTTDNPLDDGFLVGASSMIPQLFQAHPSYPVRVAQVSPQRISGQFTHWDVGVKYSSKVKDTDENPLDKPVDVTIDGELFQAPYYIDQNGNACVNSANDPYDPPLMRDDSRDVITLVENVASYDFQTQRLYRNSVNSDVFSINKPGLTGTIFPPGLAKMQTFSGTSQEKDGVTYWQRTLKIEIKEDGWLDRPLDQGFHYIPKDEWEGHPTRSIIGSAAGTSIIIKGDVTSAVSAGDTVTIVGSPDFDGDGFADHDGDYTVVTAVLTGGDTEIDIGTLWIGDFGGDAMCNPTLKTSKSPILVDGVEAKQPILLDGNGYPMDVNYQAFQPTPADAVFMEYRPYRLMPFSLLGTY